MLLACPMFHPTRPSDSSPTEEDFRALSEAMETVGEWGILGTMTDHHATLFPPQWRPDLGGWLLTVASGKPAPCDSHIVVYWLPWGGADEQGCAAWSVYEDGAGTPRDGYVF